MMEAEPAQAGNQPRDPASARRAARRAGTNRAMRLFRRSHLYAGLFMTPWVFLYGITALLFNHPDAFPDRPAVPIGEDAFAGTPIAGLPAPGDLAARIVEDWDRPGFRLVRPADASFTRELAATARSGGRQYAIRIDLETREGTAREVIERPKPDPAPFASKGPRSAADRPPLANLEASLPAALARAGIPAAEVAVRTGPELGFLVEGEGRTWKVQYDLTSGTISGRPEDAAGEPLSTRRFLTRLHLAHGYPARFGARWAWAVAVDLMFISMVGWGTTGLVMWWQMKNVRRIGLIVLAASAVVATILAVGMHGSIAVAGAAAKAEAPAAEKPGGGRPAKPARPAPASK